MFDKIMLYEKNSYENSMKLDPFTLGFSFASFLIFIILGEFSNKLFLLNIVSYMKIMKQIGWIGLFFTILYEIVYFSILHDCRNYFWIIPVISILLPIFSSDLSSFISVAITILSIVLFIFHIMNKIPEKFIEDVILEWEYVLGIIFVVGGIYIFLSHYFSNTIYTYKVQDFKDKVDAATCSSVFIYTFFSFCVILLNRKLKKITQNTRM